MYAVIEAGGSQHRVQIGDLLTINRVNVDGANVDVGQSLELDRVLLLAEESGLKVGSPYVSGAKVVAEVVDLHRGDKVDVFKYNRRHRTRKGMGFRQSLTTVRIQSIG